MMTKQELYPGEWEEAKEFVASMRAYVLGHLLKEERERLEAELDGCLISSGNADVIAQRDILRRESDALWKWKRGVQAQLDLEGDSNDDEKA